ncbi:MAG: 2-octaprenyl-6-methoxyphenyl hydroxylase [Cellvibrionaceae bacterium]
MTSIDANVEGPLNKRQLDDADVAIVGGGMVGISLAVLLAKENPDLRITLLESFPFNPSDYHSSFDARSTALSAGSREILERCGLWLPLSEHLTRIRQVHVSDKGHFGGSVLDAREYGLDAVGYVVENPWLGKVLAGRLEAFQRIRCLAPASVSKAQATARGYCLTVERKGQVQEFNCQLLVLADGVNSQLRGQLGIALDQQDYDQSAIIANIIADRPHAGVAYERFTADGPIALLPLGESDQSHTMALIWTLPTDRAEALGHCSDGEFLQGLQDYFGYRQGVFQKVGVRHLYPLQLSLAKEQVRRSLVLMGNAAHSLHPVAGQGFNLALRDCLALSEALGVARGAGLGLHDPCLLHAYIQKQAADQRATIQLSDGFVRWFSNSDSAKSLLRNLGLLALDALPPAKRLLAWQTMGLG